MYALQRETTKIIIRFQSNRGSRGHVHWFMIKHGSRFFTSCHVRTEFRDRLPCFLYLGVERWTLSVWAFDFLHQKSRRRRWKWPPSPIGWFPYFMIIRGDTTGLTVSSFCRMSVTIHMWLCQKLFEHEVWRPLIFSPDWKCYIRVVRLIEITIRVMQTVGSLPGPHSIYDLYFMKGRFRYKEASERYKITPVAVLSSGNAQNLTGAS